MIRYGKRVAQFSIKNWLFKLDPPQDEQLASPLIQAPGLEITDWVNQNTPKLNGKPLALDEHETSRCLAIAPDNQKFLIGTEWTLRLFDRNGIQLWNVATPAIVRGINISGDGKIAVAALGNGMLRWYRMSDSTELLTFFPHKDIKSILPPIITILSPAPGTLTESNKLVIFYDAVSTTGSITDVEARIQGRPAKVLDNIYRTLVHGAKKRMIGQITIEVPAEDVVVSLIARNKHGESEPANYLTSWVGDKDWYKPNLYVLAVGVSRYNLEHLCLKYAANEEDDMELHRGCCTIKA